MPRDDQWILTAPCGCPIGVMEGSVARDEHKALVEMYGPDHRQVQRAKERGMKMKLISFQEYTEEYYSLMHIPCPH